MSDQCDCEIPLYYCTDRPDCRMVALVASKTPDEITTLRAQLAASEARANELNAMLEHCRDEAAETERMLRAEYANAESRAEETRRLYDELLYQVSMKHLGESRHQTALRYLRQSESNVCWPDSAALAEGDKR